MKIPLELDGLSKRDLVRVILSQDQKIEYQSKKIEDLERRLLAYENAHTPPSKQMHYPKREKKEDAKRGAPKGHKGVTRKTPDPTESKTLQLDACPHCCTALGKPKYVERRVIEELPDPQPLRVIEFFVPHYHCSHCNKEIVAADPELPSQGNLGNNLQAQIALMKYEDRLPHRKIADVLNRQYGLQLSPGTIFDVTRRVSDKLAPYYDEIKQEIPKSPALNADETGAKLEGKKHWLWLFMSLNSVLFLLREKRDSKVVKEILGENYLGILTCDGLKQYQTIVKEIQRCWAHLLREAKFLAQKHEGQARNLYNSLCELFTTIKTITTETPLHTRETTHNECIKKMQSFTNIANKYAKLKKLATTIQNGLEQWFTCVLHPEIEPTNNRAEREIREFVIQRKISSTFRSEKGLRITETIMSLLATWKLRGLNTYSMLRTTLSS